MPELTSSWQMNLAVLAHVACRAAETGHGDLEDLVAAAVTAGLAEAEARRTVASAARKVVAR